MALKVMCLKLNDALGAPAPLNLRRDALSVPPRHPKLDAQHL